MSKPVGHDVWCDCIDCKLVRLAALPGPWYVSVATWSATPFEPVPTQGRPAVESEVEDGDLEECPCPDCKGTGIYRGLRAIEPCRKCGGEGVLVEDVMDIIANLPPGDAALHSWMKHELKLRGIEQP